VNLSTRTFSGTGEKSAIVGFGLGGASAQPALTAFGVIGALADPQLRVVNDTLRCIVPHDSPNQVYQLTAARRIRLSSGRPPLPRRHDSDRTRTPTP
jgi:hypothetical protein